MDDVRWCEVIWYLGVDVMTAQAAESGTYPILWDGICRTNDYPESTCDHDRIRIESVYEKNICKLSHNQLMVYIPIFDIVGNCFVTLVLSLATMFPHFF